MDFQVGDRIRCITDSPEGNTEIHIGSEGTVVGIFREMAYLKIRWDMPTGRGHDCDGLCEWGHGWNVRYNYVEFIDDSTDGFAPSPAIDEFLASFCSKREEDVPCPST